MLQNEQTREMNIYIEKYQEKSKVLWIGKFVQVRIFIAINIALKRPK